MPGEMWKDIPGWEGYYQASTMGRIKYLQNYVRCRKNALRTIKEHICKQSFLCTGYLRVTLHVKNTKRGYMVHRLIALTFLHNPNNEGYVDHIDTNIVNNCSNNLKWVSQKENCNNPTTLGKKRKPVRHEIPIICYYNDGKSVTLRSISQAKSLGFNVPSVRRCLSDKSKTHKGCTFRYAD